MHPQGRLASGQLLQEDEAEVVVIQSATVVKKSPSSAGTKDGILQKQIIAVSSHLAGSLCIETPRMDFPPSTSFSFVSKPLKQGEAAKAAVHIVRQEHAISICLTDWQ